MNRLVGKAALITATGQGIGRAAPALFAAQGAMVIVTGINADSLATLDGISGITTAHKLDLRNVEDVSAAVADIGPVGGRFNCAGHLANGVILDCEEADWDAGRASLPTDCKRKQSPAARATS